MILAIIMLIILASLIAFWRGSRAAVPLFLLALIITAVVFYQDMTTPLTISL
ncbi:hypothetical protein ACELLULO517_26655 [Acidisoma cellulosilytica]|uniref:Uncharacterized protein n=1 Tax=Acidisoma cellulosilyticum TaxID=2802395 RepID=A0A963Z7C2_9PROT|nr:hypothetical protein [Acidisoma cellulosilyticum]MCB8883856.1 hypothetical protein [Acidisoma cellulosilyticum]